MAECYECYEVYARVDFSRFDGLFAERRMLHPGQAYVAFA
jgi:hypothetical protein